MKTLKSLAVLMTFGVLMFSANIRPAIAQDNATAQDQLAPQTQISDEQYSNDQPATYTAQATDSSSQNADQQVPGVSQTQSTINQQNTDATTNSTPTTDQQSTNQSTDQSTTSTTELPQTGSDLPLVALIGAISLSAAVGLRLLAKTAV